MHNDSISAHGNRDNILEAKRRLPLPQLMAQLGHGDAAKKSARCPFHDDSNNSFSVFQNEDGWHGWKCFRGCGQGDEIEFLAKVRSLQKGAAIREFLKLAGVDNGKPPIRRESLDWKKCVADFSEADEQKLAAWRGLSIEFVRWLHAQNSVGIFEGKIAFANHGDVGAVVSAHFRLDSGIWNFKPKGHKTAPLIFGNPKTAGFVMVFESQFDAFAVMDKFGWHTSNGLPDTAVLITRSAANGKLIAGRLSPDAVCYAFKQNDVPTPKKPIPAGDVWLADVASHAGCHVLNVATPAQHKDANDWTRAGASEADLRAAMKAAKPVQLQTAMDIKTESASDADTFDKITSDIRGDIIGLLSDKNATPSAQRREICGRVIAALNRVGRFYFHADLRDFDSALFFNRFTKRLERLRADAFTSWLSEWLCINRADALFKYVIAAVETEALSGERTTGILPESFWASRPGTIYISNGDGQAAKITADGVQLVDNGTDGVLFAAGRTLQPWNIITAQDIFQTCEIFRNARCAASHALDLIRLWIYSLPTIPRSKPPICLAGDIGSGKTRLAKAIAEFFGIPFVAAKVEESKEDDFWPNVDAGGIYTVDNADTKCRWLADALANAATDGCSRRRKLYTDSEKVTLRPRAWICVTTANPTFASDAGLADRLQLVRMARRDDQETSDSALTDEILANRDAGLSHLAETLRAALADTAPTPAGLNRRHPDFAAFAVRIGRALGREAEAVAALKHAEADKSAFCLENDNIGAALLAYLRTVESFTGTANELAPHLVEIDPELSAIKPLSAKKLGKRLAAIWPHLQASLSRCRRETDRAGVWRFEFCQSAGFAGFQSAISLKP
jgi:hypothetical protein